jgi:oligopeptide/dipeptide ABC transporter ATP-binding protein
VTTASVGPLLDVQELTVEFTRGWRQPPLRAVDGVSLSLAARETIGLVGESGSGKTTIGRAILGLVPIKKGSISFDGKEIAHANYRERRAFSAELQVVFQDPYSSLNPTRTIRQTLAETLRVHSNLSRATLDERVETVLAQVGLPPDTTRRYPAHFSGGQRQRIAIARALIAHPRLVICDEPTSALDLSVQAQVLNLLHDLQNDFHLSYLLISHDLAVVRHLSHRIIVIYQGRIMEHGDAATVYANPIHPYTQALIAAVPDPDPDAQRQRRVTSARSATPSMRLRDNACPFAPRCPMAVEICTTERPLLETTPTGTLVACHRWRELGRDTAAENRHPANTTGARDAQ